MPKTRLEFVLGIAFCLSITFAVFRACNKPDDNTVIIDHNQKMKDSIRILSLQLHDQKLHSDSLEQDMKVFQAKYEIQKKGLNIIIERYEKLRANHHALGAVAAVDLLSANLAADTID